ncbi:MAG: hypothetical protein AAFR24_13780 [Cyanobacteria bacterium J06627_3]
MPFSARYSPELNAVETVFNGIINEADIEAELYESHRISEKFGTSYYLVNFTDAELKLSITYIYNLPALCDRIGKNRPTRIALVNDNAQNQELVDFYKLVSQNRGWNIETFLTPNDAESWLRSNA